MSDEKKDGAALIAAERLRQRGQEGWTPAHDDDHTDHELERAAAWYALPAIWRKKIRCLWPWEPRWWKPTPGDRVHELVKAGALIAAAIDRELRFAEYLNRTR